MEESRQDVHCREIEAGDIREVEEQADRARLGVQSLPQLIGQRADAAEEDVAAQPAREHAFAFLEKDGAIRDGTRSGAPALAYGEARLDRIHAAEPHGEEDEGGEHPGTCAFEEPEEKDDDADQDDDAVFRRGKPLPGSHEPLVEHPGAGEEEHPSDDRDRDQLEHPAA